MEETPMFLVQSEIRRRFRATLLAMTSRGILMFVSVLAVGCAAGNDPGASGTDIGSGGTMNDSTTSPVTTDPSTSSSTSGFTSFDDTTTTDAADSSSTSDGSSSTGSESSTGACPAGTEGCPCDPDSDPECGDGLSCNAEDICESAACSDKKDEPNDEPTEPFELMDLSDDDPPVTAMSQLSEDTDVDWFRWGCDDPLLGLSEPNIDVDVPAQVRTCMFLDCVQGFNPVFECPEGTMEANAPIDNLPGCCIIGPGTFEIADYNCPDSSEDAVTPYLRVDGGEEGICSPYTYTYGC